jgi:hypothetical protein
MEESIDLNQEIITWMIEASQEIKELINNIQDDEPNIVRIKLQFVLALNYMAIFPQSIKSLSAQIKALKDVVMQQDALIHHQENEIGSLKNWVQLIHEEITKQTNQD